MSVAVSKAKELGLTKLAVPSAGNAGAATLAGYEKLPEEGAIERTQRVLLYNTGTGLKYLSLFAN